MLLGTVVDQGAEPVELVAIQAYRPLQFWRHTMQTEEPVYVMAKVGMSCAM